MTTQTGQSVLVGVAAIAIFIVLCLSWTHGELHMAGIDGATGYGPHKHGGQHKFYNSMAAISAFLLAIGLSSYGYAAHFDANAGITGC